MAINLTDNIRVGQQKPLDDKYFNGLSPWANETAVKNQTTGIATGLRYRGLTVNIAGVEWWWKDGIADNQLVIKSVDLTGYVPFTGATQEVDLNTQDLKAGQIWLWDPFVPNGDGIGDYGRIYIENDEFHVRGGNPLWTHNIFYTSDAGITNFKYQGFDVRLNATLLTDSREWHYPDKDGTIALLDDVTASTVTKTSQLINDGDNGTTHFISLEDLPSNLTLYATNVASGINSYTKAVSSLTDPDFNPAPGVDITTPSLTSTTVGTYCGGIISSSNIITGNPGIFTMSTIGNIKKVSGSADAVFYYEVYKRTAEGTETLIVTSSNTAPVSSNIYTEFNAAALFNNGLFVATDRIVIKFYGLKLSNASSPVYSFQFGGTSPVRTTLPVPLTVVPTLKLDDLQDVTVPSPASGNLLFWNSTAWVNSPLSTILGYTPKPQRRRTFSNLNYLVLSDDVYVGQIGTLTGQVTVTLPLANTVAAGYEIIIADDSGTVTSTNSILIARSGSDTIVGNTSVTIGAAFGMRRFFSDGVSKWSYDVGALRASNNLSDVSSSTTALLNLGGIPLQTPQTTGVALSFVADSVYGTISSPETGNITFNTTNAKLGVTNIIIHNNTTTAPTFATNMKKLSGSSSYVINTINYIYITYINATEVIYSINQRT